MLTLGKKTLSVPILQGGMGVGVSLGELGVDHILEVGPGKALSGFVKKTLPGVECAAVETPEELDAVLDANLKGAFLCCKEAARRMVRQRYGRIVNLSSVVALRGNAGQTNYAASKAGLIGLTKSLARELASRNVTVNAVAPGFIETDMTAALPEAVRAEMAKGIPAGRAGSPEDVANAVAFFTAEQSSYLTGQVLCVDGGMAM